MPYLGRFFTAGSGGGVRGVTFSRDGTKLVSSVWGETIRMFEVATGKLLSEFQCPSPGGCDGTHVNLSPEARFLAGTGNGNAWVWDTTTGQQVLCLVSQSLAADCTGKDVALPDGQGVGNWNSGISSDGRYLALVHKDGTIRIWEVSSGQETRRIVGAEAGGKGNTRFHFRAIIMATSPGVMSVN